MSDSITPEVVQPDLKVTIGQAPIVGRGTLGVFMTERGMREAVEVGTHQGVFAELLMRHWRHGTLHCVDPYTSGYDPGDPASEGDRRADREIAGKRLQRFRGVRFRKQTSIEASRDFQDGTLDLVYIDGKHRYASVLADLRAWWPKVRSGGFLCGHDIVCPWEVNGGWGREVQPAVFEFARQTGVVIQLIVETEGRPWSYLLEKP